MEGWELRSMDENQVWMEISQNSWGRVSGAFNEMVMLAT